ncbi:hypothetical protein I656_04058 [Geobacillus sp. WSUCF1]|nr:hypothetical protein I656_04058 [Geobacillus sp. WSUCF1]
MKQRQTKSHPPQPTNRRRSLGRTKRKIRSFGLLFYLFFPITNPFIMNKRGAYSYYGPIIAAEQDRR